MPKAIIVIPCFNEAKRLSAGEVASLVKEPAVEILFVDDGSTDRTVERVTEISGQFPGKVKLLSLEQNCGKAEAVRRGMLAALESTADFIGYADADFATSASEILRLLDVLGNSPAKVVLGSRVRLLGTEIQRRPMRHYLGRAFATCASYALKLQVYDTQCGAKFFRVSPILQNAFQKPFRSRWIFDVELLSRLLTPGDCPGYSSADFIEVPLQRWKDVAGSKLNIPASVRAGFDLLYMAWEIRRQPPFSTRRNI